MTYEPYDDPYPTSGLRYDAPDRIAHLVFLDGQLVDAWTESPIGTRWQAVADQRDRDRHRVVAEPLPATPPHARGLEWLADICGGIEALDALVDAPLASGDRGPTHDQLDPQARACLDPAIGLIRSVVLAQLDEELTEACETALIALWSESPEVVRNAPSPRHLVGGICWAVGKANGTYGAQGALTQTSMQRSLALTTPISSYGQRVAAALRGLLPGRPRPHEWRGVPDLEPLGRTDLLTRRTRRQLIALRDQARRQAESAA